MTGYAEVEGRVSEVIVRTGSQTGLILIEIEGEVGGAYPWSLVHAYTRSGAAREWARVVVEKCKRWNGDIVPDWSK